MAAAGMPKAAIACRHMALSIRSANGHFILESPWCRHYRGYCGFAGKSDDARRRCRAFADPFPVNRLPERR